MYFKILSLQLINSLISLVGLLGYLLLNSHYKSLLAKLFFFLSTYLTLKSHSYIYASYFVIKALGKSIAI